MSTDVTEPNRPETGTDGPATDPGATDPGATDAAAQYALLAPLVPTGLDVRAARARVETAAAARRRTRRVLAGSCAALVVVAGCVAVALLGGTDPGDVVADGDRRSERSTTTVSSTTTVEEIEIIQVAPTVETIPPLATTTLPATTVPVTVAPPPTSPPPPAPNQPLQLSLTVATPRLDAGDVARIDVAWHDADHGGVAPHLSVDWGDPAVSVLTTVPPSSPCDVAGPPTGGTDQILFRYATPGVHEVVVTASTCDGLGPYGERVRTTARIEVVEPAGGAERAVVAHVARPATEGEPLLDDAVAELVAVDSTVTPLAERRPALAQYTSSGPATVLRVPLGARGSLRLTWPGSACTASGPIDLPAAPPDRAPQVLLDRTC